MKILKNIKAFDSIFNNLHLASYIYIEPALLNFFYKFKNYFLGHKIFLNLPPTPTKQPLTGGGGIGVGEIKN
ncbi:hypothetical protein [Spiroplasma endosymbiont of Virgichneumon dumeticola]|uniref:hypothetical protein n=1 Tax=Spiroplasma endosymbiont of Virgichneumon dumeticola TaxID=3139323 RepID=UPI0035C8C81C